MSLTYSQKQLIQKNYPSQSVEELSKELGISVQKVQKHIDKNAKFFENKIEDPSANEDMEVFGFSNIKSWFKQNWMNVLVLLFFVIVAYINAFGAGFVSDDIQGIVELEEQIKKTSYITHNPSFIPRSILFYFAYQIGGMTPIAFRIINIFFHLGNVFLVYILAGYFSRKQIVAFIAAALVAVHPMMIESVTWISGGIYAQAAFFLLLTFLLYITAKDKKKIIYLVFSGITFVLSLSVSEKVIIFPFIILVYEFSFGSLMKRWYWSLPYFAISTAWGIMMLGRVASRVEYLQRTNGTTQAIQFYNPFVQIPVALATYIKLYLWPFGLTLYHSEFKMNLVLYAIYLIVAIIFLSLWYLAYKKNRMLFFWISFFFITLLPTMNPFGLSWIVAERYAYLGSVGLFIVVAYLIGKLIDSKTYKTVGYIILTVMLIGYTVRTLWRNSEWQNVDTLWVATGKTSPSDPKTHNNLGDMHARHGDMDKAVAEFSEAIRLNPNYAAAWYNLGNTYKFMNKEDEALKHFLVSIEKDPSIWQGYMNIAVIYFNKQDYVKSEEYLKKSIQLNPTNPSLYANLGVVYFTTGRKPEAQQYLAKALELDPKNAFALEWNKRINEAK